MLFRSGRVLNTLGHRVADKQAFLRDYKFTIAFENESHPGYTTEKIVEPMLADSIPIYWGDPLVGTDFEVESWLEHLAQKFVRQFDPWSYWTISRAMDLFDFGAFGVRPGEDGLRHRGATDTAAAARQLELERALVIGVREDLLFPVDQQREMGQVLGEAGVDCEYVELSSPYGHDAFLTETELFTPLLRDFLLGLTEPVKACRAASPTCHVDA